MKRLLLLLVLAGLVSGLPAPSAAQPDPLAHRATLITTSGKVYRGWLDGYRDDRVRLRLTADGGEAIYQFAPGEIRSLVFPDADQADEAMTAADPDPTGDTLQVLERIWTNRAPYLPALDSANRAPLLLYAEGLLASKRPLEAVARARRLTGIALDEAESERMAAVVLLGYEEAGLHEEAVVLAENWCRTHPASGPSVIGWAVLARQGLREKNWEEVLWLGLHPVAFGHDSSAVGLNACYAAVVAAGLELDDAATAVAVFNEMQEREIDWPEHEPLFAEAATLIQSALLPGPAAEEILPADEPAGPPIPDPWLTLEAIRRVLAKPGS